MRWKDYVYQPIGHVLRRSPVAAPEAWLEQVHRHGALRVLDEPLPKHEQPAASLEAAVGQYFRPDAPVNFDVLQIAGLLLKRNQMDREASARSARRNGGGLYFRWFLAQVDESLPDPLPTKEFPLHPSRWRKERAGHRSRDAK